MRPRVHIALALSVAGLSACGPGKVLEGSISPLLDLRYERAEARYSAEHKEVSVSFLSPQGAGEDTLFKVTARLAGLPELEPRQTIDLAERLSAGGPTRGTVGRSVLNEPVRDFPEIVRGGLTFEDYLDPGTTVTGEFNVTFANGTDVYSGRTVFGRFEATVPQSDTTDAGGLRAPLAAGTDVHSGRAVFGRIEATVP